MILIWFQLIIHAHSIFVAVALYIVHYFQAMADETLQLNCHAILPLKWAVSITGDNLHSKSLAWSSWQICRLRRSTNSLRHFSRSQRNYGQVFYALG